MLQKIVYVVLAGLAFSLFSCKTPDDGADAVSGASPAEVDRAVTFHEIQPSGTEDRVLVVYFSQGTAGRRVAEDLALLLNGDIERIIEKKNRKGFFGFMGAGADSSFKRASPIEDPVFSPAEYDLVIVCTPVWAWSLAPPVRTYLQLTRGELSKTVYITVSGDTDPDKIVKMMEKASGKAPVAYESFVEKDFSAENRSVYLGKLKTLLDKL